MTTARRDIAPRRDRAVYMAASGEPQIDVRIDSETVWLTQAQLAELELRALTATLSLPWLCWSLKAIPSRESWSYG